MFEYPSWLLIEYSKQADGRIVVGLHTYIIAGQSLGFYSNSVVCAGKLKPNLTVPDN
jgi:hypothetical protein